MSQEPWCFDLLRAANPVNVDPSIVRPPQTAATFERICAEPRSPRGRLWSGRGLRARLAVGAAAIGALAAAVVVVVVAGSAAKPAFAGWRADPTPARPAQIAAALRRCGLQAPVVLAEARGPFTAVVFADRSAGSFCLRGASVSLVGGIRGVRVPGNPIAPGQVRTMAISGSDSSGHAFVLLAGRVGSAVRSIVIHRSNHVDVTASIEHGWYLAWWPAAAHATGATVTTTRGTHSLALSASATSAAPSCTKSARAGCAAVTLAGGANGSTVASGPPLILAPDAKLFHRVLLFEVVNASKVLTCFHPPSINAALLRNGPTGPCTHATLVTRLPPHYPVQKNLLELFPRGVWQVTLPRTTTGHRTFTFLVVVSGTHGYGGARKAVIVQR